MEKKVMIINWKWSDLEDEGVHINEELEGAFEEYKEDVVSGKGVFYKEYPVESSVLCIDAIVVAVSIYRTDSRSTDGLLYALVEQYAQDDNEVMVFLHRSNMYEQSDIAKLLKRFENKVAKCFLFADRRDYIYYATQKSGFLNDSGEFKTGRDKDTKQYIETFSEEKQMVKQPYFDRVWNYYSNEFEQKIFHLKEELFNQWLPRFAPGQPEWIAKKDLIGDLQKDTDRLVFYRLKSFIGEYDVQVTAIGEEGDGGYNKDEDEVKTEQAAILKLEKTKKTSFVFDDARKNLEHERKAGRKMVHSFYTNTIEKIKGLLFTDEKKEVSIGELRQLSTMMEDLILVVPGEID